MDVFDAVTTVLAVRSYQDKPIPRDALDRILEAGRLSGSAMNAQPWRFIVVDDRETLRRIGQSIKTGPYVADAPLAIAVAIEQTPYAVSDASRAIQNMVLTAWSDGIGSNWTGFGGMTGVKALLGVPEELDLLTVLTVGYPATPVGKGEKKRKSRDEVVFRGRFGQRFD